MRIFFSGVKTTQYVRLDIYAFDEYCHRIVQKELGYVSRVQF